MRSRRRLGLVTVSMMVVCGASVLAFQSATFRGGNRTVAIYATVANAAGGLVTTLPQSSFRVTDNGRPHPLTVFSSDRQPITVVVMLDRSGSMRANFELVEQAAEAFVQQLGPGDKARIGSFSNRIQVDPRTFTSDQEALLAILRRDLQEEGPTPLWNAVNVGITALLHEEGRRVILVFTDGMDDPLNGRSSNSLGDVMKRADEENVMVYAIGLAGVAPPPGFGARRGLDPGPRPTPTRPDPGLAKLAAATGGGYFELTNTADLAATFRRVADELHHQYLLGFTPTVLDGKTHRLDVQVEGVGLNVRARRTYLASVER